MSGRLYNSEEDQHCQGGQFRATLRFRRSEWRLRAQTVFKMDGLKNYDGRFTRGGVLLSFDTRDKDF